MSNEKKTAVPELRFAEFGDQWAYLNGNVLFDPIANKNHQSDLPILAITQEHGAIPRSDIDYNVTVTDKSVESYKVVEVGDFIISLRSFQGGIEYSNHKGICSPAYIILRRKKDGADAFFKHYFKTPSFIRDLNKNIEGIRDGKMVSYKQFSDLLLPAPSPEEQQKIAATLSSLDDLLTAQSAKLAALQAHKRGLMQGLFPAEGETVPKLRFAEFAEDGEWVEKSLGDIVRKARLGGNYQSAEDNGGVPVIKMGNLGRGKISLNKVERLAEDSSYVETDLLRRGDLLFNTRNTLELVGKVAIWHDELPMALYNSNIMRLEFDKKVVNSNYFMNYLFNTQVTLGKLKTIATGTTSVAAIYGKDLYGLIVLIPSLDEQQKIAACLTSLDDLIAAQGRKLAALRLHKKGLMQGLFPAVAAAA